MADDLHAEAFARLYSDRVAAHRVLFSHRHPQADPPFHRTMIDDWHSANKRVLHMAFRGSAKSTRGEEAVCIRAGFREFKNCLIVGVNFDRAAQRLHAIRYEIENNERLTQLFGDLRGDTWGADQIILSSGIMIQAIGRGQSLRGTKHLDARPDLVFIDDLEGRDDARTPEARANVASWFNHDLLPALDPDYRIRMAATPLDPDSLPMVLSRSPDWVTRKYPIYYLDDKGEKTATWPERFPLKAIEVIENSHRRSGDFRGFRQEYLVQAEVPEERPFKQEMFRIAGQGDVPFQRRTWQAVYAMFDPARTVNNNSATTGFACWSWIGNRLVIWDAWAKMLMPDEIVAALFEVNERFSPTFIGVEEDGLNEWLLQPIRQEQIRRGTTIPFKAMRAPKGKIDFIKGLQPFFHAREVIFSQTLPDLQAQLLSFPSGRIDTPNALAYALKMRSGAPVYDEFDARHIADNLIRAQNTPLWVCLNATTTHTTGVLVQLVGKSLRIFADWVEEGDPSTALSKILQAANLEAGKGARPVAGPVHWDQYNNVGLIQAAKRIPLDVRRAAGPENGRAELRKMFERQVAEMPAVQVSSEAKWTLNALAGGYARALQKNGVLADYAEEGFYRTLMEGIESFLGLLPTGQIDDDRDDLNYGYTKDGRKYVSALGGRR
jgi:hypothetical protein